MIIKGYSTRQFAGLKNMDIQFDENLNVVLGPNEAGKSTIVNGIVHTLFNSVKVGDRSTHDKEFKKRFMPHPGGDYIDGKININIDGEDYTLEKEWGISPSIKFILPDGTVMKDEKAIDSFLRKAIIFGEETYKRIIFSKQEDLKDAIRFMTSHDDTNVEVGDFLRRTVMELDGVSMDELEARIDAQLDEMYKRWDIDKEYPENNRGINNPYKVGIGKIVEGFYKKEDLQQKLRDARKREKELEDAYTTFKDLETNLASIRKRKAELEEIEADIRKRIQLEPGIKETEKEIEVLKEINKNWPGKRQRLTELLEEIDSLSGKLKDLDKEKELAGKAGERDRLVKKIQDVEDAEKELKGIEKEIIDQLEVTSEDIEFLDDKNLQLKEALMVINTVNIKGKVIRVPDETDISVSEGLEEQKRVAEGDEFLAKGILTIKSSNGLEIKISAGEQDMEKTVEDVELFRKQISERLEKLGVESIQEAKSIRTGQINLEDKAEKIRTRIEIILGDETLEDIKKLLSELQGLENARNLEDITKEIEIVGEQLLQKRIEKRQVMDALTLWEEKYSSEDDLLDTMVDKRAELKLKAMELEPLKRLPEEFETTDDFFHTLKISRNELDSLNTEYFSAKERYAECERNLPETSFEEMQTEFKTAQGEFNRLVRKGEALLRIKKAFVHTKVRMDQDTDKPLVESMSKYMKILTSNNYDIREIGESMKIILENKSSVKIPTELLSTGTRDSVGLAIRLALAENLLRDRKGMLVLDDCLVDMDPERKEKAVKMIIEFAKDHQVIFTTCSPQTAEQLNGNTIELQ
ncbi:AAA family ATPase [Gudongella sp. DL1XJH-153]|uniref:AAA family ATPase n=1 Tax=Gudongella sp. DL1XJH-153 TaxID=3409804 RepID=UPI003BB816D5